MSLMDVLAENFVKEFVKEIDNKKGYLNTVTAHIHNKIAAAYEHIQNNRALDAVKALSNAQNHKSTREEYLEELALFFNERSTSSWAKNQDVKSALDCFEKAQNELDDASDKLNKVLRLDVIKKAASLEEVANLARKEADLAGKEAFDECTSILKPELDVKTVAHETPESCCRPEAPHVVAPVHDRHTDLLMLGGFIAALGVTAVAIAFAALNLSGLTMPGLLLGGFGFTTTLVGYSMFTSSAANVDDYVDNITNSFYSFMAV